MIFSADNRIRRFGAPTFKVNDLECRLSNSTIGNADREEGEAYLADR